MEEIMRKIAAAATVAVLLGACGVEEAVNTAMGTEFGCCAKFAGENATWENDMLTEWDCRDWPDLELNDRNFEAADEGNTFLCSFRNQ